MGIKYSKRAKQHQESVIGEVIISNILISTFMIIVANEYAIIDGIEWNKYCSHSETSFLTLN